MWWLCLKRNHRKQQPLLKSLKTGSRRALSFLLFKALPPHRSPYCPKWIGKIKREILQNKDLSPRRQELPIIPLVLIKTFCRLTLRSLPLLWVVLPRPWSLTVVCAPTSTNALHLGLTTKWLATHHQSTNQWPSHSVLILTYMGLCISPRKSPPCTGGRVYLSAIEQLQQ